MVFSIEHDAGRFGEVLRVLHEAYGEVMAEVIRSKKFMYRTDCEAWKRYYYDAMLVRAARI